MCYDAITHRQNNRHDRTLRTCTFTERIIICCYPRLIEMRFDMNTIHTLPNVIFRIDKSYYILLFITYVCI